MPTELRITEAHWSALRGHLLQPDGEEHAAILVCGPMTRDDGIVLLVREIIALAGDDLLSSGRSHLSISPIALARAAKVARVAGSTLVLCHSHPFGGQVRASELDLTTEAELCGRALAGRLAPLEVGALVVGPDGLDGRLWSNGTAAPLDRVRIIGANVSTLTGHARPNVTDFDDLASEEDGSDEADERTERQVRAWGATGQKALSHARIGVVGCGGTGSHVATQLAHLGVRDLTLVDHDVVEVTNLSRIVGSTPGDVGLAKVDVIAAAITRVSPAAVVTAVRASVLDVDPLILAGLDLVFCATDGHGSRSLLNEISQQYLLPVIDLGVEVVPGVDRVRAGGQVRVLRPGQGCLLCAGTLDPALIRQEYLSEGDLAMEAAHGYVRGSMEPAPSVIALNGVIASLAVLEACQMLAGMYTTPRSRLLLRGDERALSTAAMPQTQGCHVCGDGGLVGRGDSAPSSTRWKPVAACESQ